MEEQTGPKTPIGTTPMDTRVFKEPRGFMRCLQFFFAIFAFSTCAHFSNQYGYNIICINSPDQPIRVVHSYSYPFRMDHEEGIPFQCPVNDTQAVKKLTSPGDFKSDAEFFVFTGVISMLGSIACLIVYVFFSELYANEDKKAPMIDFCFTVLLAVFWLSASAAWANGLTGIKAISDGNWIFHEEDHPCDKTDAGTFHFAKIKQCDILNDVTTSYATANISILLGFLNFFLWSSNLWFLYKETSWFAARSGASQLEG